MIGSDFIRLETEMRAQEEQDAREYSEFLNDTDLDKTAKNKDLEHENQLKQDQEQTIAEKKANLAGTQKESNSAMAYYNKLILHRLRWDYGYHKIPRLVSKGIRLPGRLFFWHRDSTWA